MVLKDIKHENQVVEIKVMLSHKGGDNTGTKKHTTETLKEKKGKGF